MASKWKRPFVKLLWYPKVFTADVVTYSSLGIKHITSLGCGIDKYYYDTHGEPPIKEHGIGLLLISNIECRDDSVSICKSTVIERIIRLLKLSTTTEVNFEN